MTLTQTMQAQIGAYPIDSSQVTWIGSHFIGILIFVLSRQPIAEQTKVIVKFSPEADIYKPKTQSNMDVTIEETLSLATLLDSPLPTILNSPLSTTLLSNIPTNAQ